MTLNWRPYIRRHIVQLVLILVVLYFAMRMGRSIAQERLRLEYVFFLTALVFASFLIMRPLYGLYLFCLSAVLIPWWVNNEFFKLISPNLFFVMFPLILLAGDLAQHKKRLLQSRINLPLGFAGVALILGVLRYGMGYIRYPQVFINGAVLFVLSSNVVRTRQQIVRLTLVLAAATTLISVYLCVENLIASSSGDWYSSVRAQTGFYRTDSTSRAELLSFFVPLLSAMFVSAERRSERFLFGAAVLSSSAVIGISGTRIGVASMVTGCLLLIWLMPGRRAKLSWVLGLMLISLYIGTLLFPNMWQVAIQTTQLFLAGSDARMIPWRYALEGFLSNPLVGSRLGPHHSYLLGRAQEMGLLFLMPFGLALWHVWRHTRWLQRHETEPMMRAFVIGFQASLLLAVAQNFVSTSWQLGEYAMFFWLLAGAQEALYYQARDMPAEVRIRT